ncbi:MAG TPA: SDR family oxidoreductase [Vicinamibacterales bacterium]|jgi:NAD(P)-dependent dehydrogenase (short-subunit alcohol dehydrogenase family)|nr:SDR family oxidoreductase [Vicinamibacterales bacterium]
METTAGAIVTGGSQGIGYAIAEALLKRGMRVAITGRDAGRLAAAAQRLGAGDRVLRLAGDVGDATVAQALVDQAAAAFGGLDVLVNNAGIGLFGNVSDFSVEDWDRLVATNVSGVFYCTRAAIPHLRRRGGGWVINISSLAGVNPFPGAAAYCASKAALDAFTMALMQEVRHDGIRVAAIAPGSVATGFSGRRGEDGADWKLAPADVAQVVVDLIAHPSRSLPSRVELRPSRPRR